MPSKRKQPSSSPKNVCQAAIDPLTPSEALAEREFSLNPDYLKVKLLMLTSEFLVATRNNDTDVLLGVSTIDYLARGFELIGLKSVSSVLSNERSFVSDYESALSQALFSLSADRSLDKYRLPELPSAAFPHEDTRFDFSPPQDTSANLHLRIELENSSPPIWRRIVVPSAISLGDLHDVIQVAFGWDDQHLHQFHIKRKVYSCTAETDPRDHVDYNNLDDFNFRKGSKFRYVYDFGDNWAHAIQVEEIDRGSDDRWEILAGERTCPPEDCGGIGRYQDLLAALQDTSHSLHNEALECLGCEYDPAAEVECGPLEAEDAGEDQLDQDAQIVIITPTGAPFAPPSEGLSGVPQWQLTTN